MQHVFVEYLTVVGWCFSILPRLVWYRKARETQRVVYFVEAGRWALVLANFTAKILYTQVEKLQFRGDDIVDQNGNVVWIRVLFEDMADAVHLIHENAAFDWFTNSEISSASLKTYLQKQLLPGAHVTHMHSLWRAIYVIQVFLWKIDQECLNREQTSILLRPRLWGKELFTYAQRHGAIKVRFPFGATELWAQTVRIMRLFAALEKQKIIKKIKSLFLSHKRIHSTTAHALVAGEFWGDLNLDQPAFYSDFFFWQQSTLPSENLIALFKSAGSRALTEDYWQDLKHHHIQAVALNQTANKYKPEFVYDTAPDLMPQIWGKLMAALFTFSREKRWLYKETVQFAYEADYWYHLFLDHNIKIYTTWFKYNSEHCIIAQAIERVGGIMTVYQRAYEGVSCMQLTLAVDVYFAFAKSGATLESLSRSYIGYHVTVGLMSDHRNVLVIDDAKKMRKHLQAKGAQHVVAFFDENSTDDDRWFSGHQGPRTDYAFWLGKVLETSDFGLILKPKRASTLRQRLGDVTDLLDRALATGRCHLFDEDTQGYVSPVQAAKSADVAVHCSLYATTAAMEAVLADVPTLIKFDGYNKNPLYDAGRGKFVFDEWACVWEACQDYWQIGGRDVCLQFWAPLLDELDPFRDGRAAERMGTYLHWLIEGCEQGLRREDVMANAAEKYGRLWGWDFVQEVRPGRVLPFSNCNN